MAKYNFEFKLQVVNEYLRGDAGYWTLSKRYGIDTHVIRRWVSSFKQFGEDGLRRSRGNKSYTFEFKLHVVELYLTSELSYQELALQVGMPNSSQITRWVLDYKAAGVDALKTKRKGRKRKMDNDKLIHAIESNDSDEQKELLKQLQEENLRLRIENAFLKEVRRLRLEEEALLRKQRESSTASEENSN